MSEKDVMQRAEDLVKSVENTEPDKEEKILEIKEEEIKDNKKKSLVPTDAEELIPSKKDKDNPQVFKVKKLGYHRQTHYKPPRWWHFLGMTMIILILIAIIGILMPYIPPEGMRLL